MMLDLLQSRARIWHSSITQLIGKNTLDAEQATIYVISKLMQPVPESWTVLLPPDEGNGTEEDETPT